MKKIIATVLAMVMALALCSTAFAATATYDKAYNEKGTDITAGATYTVTTDAATYNKTTGAGSVEVKKVTYGTTTETYVVATKADYDLKLTSDTQADLYLTKVINNGQYLCKATAFTAIGTKCGQYDGVTTSKYYTNTNNYKSDDDVVLFRESDADTAADNVLVDGKLVKVTYVGKLDDLTNPHDWKAASYDKDGKALTFKCAECGTVATVYKTEDAAWAAGVNTVEVFKGYVLGYNFNAENAGSTTTGSKPSPKTFDAGIALYAAMALTSVAGSAVVIGKKKEF